MLLHNIVDGRLTKDHVIIEVGGCENSEGIQSLYTIWATFDGDVLNQDSKYTTSSHAYGSAAAEPVTTCKGL